MKLMNKLLVFTALICVSLSACQKDDTPGDNSNPPNVGDSNYLDKIYELYENGYGIDTENIYTVHYDNSKRVIAINYKGTTSGNSDVSKSFYYSYNGIDTLPYKSTSIIIYPSSSFDTTNTYYFYDAQKRNLKDSIINTSLKSGNYNVYNEIDEYSYNDGKLYGRSIAVGFSNPVYEKDTASIDQNGNILLNQKYYFDGHTFKLVNTSNLVYDDHLSPFAKLSNFKAHRKFARRHLEMSFFEHLDFNNRVSQTETDNMGGGNYSYMLSYSYVYNASGLPIKQNISYVGGLQIGSKIVSRIFRYRSL